MYSTNSNKHLSLIENIVLIFDYQLSFRLPSWLFHYYRFTHR